MNKQIAKTLYGYASDNRPINKLTVNALSVKSFNLAGIINGSNIFTNIQIFDSQINNTSIGIDSPNVGKFTELISGQPGTGYLTTFYGNTLGNYTQWDPVNNVLTVNGATAVRDTLIASTIDSSCGSILNLKNITSCVSDLYISSGNILLNTTSNLIFGNNYIQSNEFGLTVSGGKLSLLSDITVLDQLFFGSTSSNISFGSGDLTIQNSLGNINLIPMISTGSVNIPLDNKLIFGNSNNWIYGDNSSLHISSPVVNIDGQVNITGSLNVLNTFVNSDSYILPVGTSYYIPITAIQNYTSGSLQITTSLLHYFSIGDTLNISNSDSDPVIDGFYTVVSVLDPFNFIVSGTTLTTPGTTGTVRTDLKFQQNKDVGIQVNYYTDSAQTWGSANYKTGFFGLKLDTGNFTVYKEGTNVNDVFTGTLGTVEADTGLFNHASVGNMYFGNLVSQIERVSCSVTSSSFTVSPVISTTIVNIADGPQVIASATMPSVGLIDGQIKYILINTLNTNGSLVYLYFHKLQVPGGNASALKFKRTGQSVEIMYDKVDDTWRLLMSGAQAIP